MPNVFRHIIQSKKILLVVLAAMACLLVARPMASRAQWQRLVRRIVIETPVLQPEACAYDNEARQLTLRGNNFRPETQVTLFGLNGVISFERATLVDDTRLIVEGVTLNANSDRVTVTVTNPTTNAYAMRAPSVSIELTMSAPMRRQISTVAADIARASAPDQAGSLSTAEVEKIIAQAAAEADANNLKVTIAVVDAEGNALGVFSMTGAAPTTRIGKGTACTPTGCASLPLSCGLEGVCVPSCAAALAKAITGSFLSSQGHAFSTRTASYIVQEHFPPGVTFQPSGPLFGVQFSQLLCSDVNPRSALGLSADPGGLPLYKNGIKVGGIGIEGDGRYTSAENINNLVEEVIALAGARSFEAPDAIKGDKIIVNGIRFPYVKAAVPPARTVQAFAALSGTVNSCLGLAPAATRGTQPSDFIAATLNGAPAGRINTKKFPGGAASYGSSADLSQAEVVRILAQAAQQAFITRAAIRQPLNSAAEVNIAVCDADGKLLGIFSTQDAPIFGFDVAAQKARTAAFFSHANAATRLLAAGLSLSVNASQQDGIPLNGSQAYSARAIGFLARPYYPDGIDRSLQGPYAVGISQYSPFNLGLQANALTVPYVENLLRFINNNDMAAGADAFTSPCGNPALNAVANGFQIFPGGVPLYKNGKLVGGIGISGDGVDQDDIIAAMGSTGFEAPESIRSDQLFVRGTRLPFVKFPRNPNRD